MFHIGKKLSFGLFGGIGLIILVHGCGNIAKKMSAGEVLYRAKCSSCHNIIAPSRHDKELWRLYIDKYGEKMTAEEKQTVLRYLADSE